MGFHFIQSLEDFPRLDYRLSIGENARRDRITFENAYDLPYIRMVYRRVGTGEVYNIYELWSVEYIGVVMDASV